ncbi:MAG: hypothetical protein DRG87_02745 [Deltaproteobacteria bacterium]|nr:DUF4258 domain-containing protein [Deltaproteobacteria bacterium]MBW2076451.1 DUF4258 domain-containing protein [Deltaproteobacteria bacterium]MBW2310057.1 DUF4258 domain-containing protein [Deltaproteobacteria bacterium]RLB31307.1 MAG: hypothetical protein DRG87_02745 [Deltaproteobacteria bacterium]
MWRQRNAGASMPVAPRIEPKAGKGGNSMKVSNHANKRSQQRGIPKDYIDLILEYGTPVRRQGDTLEYRLHKKDRDRLVKHLKQLINSIDRCTNKAVLVDSDMKEIVTVYNLM